jgi:hypothetical protein
MTKIDPYSLTTVPLEQCADGNSFGIATGFIWQRREQHYLITNWHVVTGRNARTGELETPVQPDMLRTKDQSDAQLGMVWPAEDINNIIDAAKHDQ